MPRHIPSRLSFALAASLALAACAGDIEDASQTAPDTLTFAAAYSGGLAALKTAAGLASSGFADLFDSSYLENGISKADIAAALAADAGAAAGTSAAELSSFPQVQLSDVQVTGCNAATQLCTLTVTVSNNDADSTSITYTTQVKYTDKVRLYGDQSKS